MEEKFKTLIDAKVLLCSALFKDVLADAKILLTQKQNIDILKIFEAVESTKNRYQLAKEVTKKS